MKRGSWGESAYVKLPTGGKVRSTSQSRSRAPVEGSRPARAPLSTSQRQANPASPVRGTATSAGTTGQHRAQPAVNPSTRRQYPSGGSLYQYGGHPVPGGESTGMMVEGPSHEAGGVTLGGFGRSDVGVEGNEAIELAGGEPNYVFSDEKIKGTNKTFAQEYERLLAKEDFKKIRDLKMTQERQMGQVRDVTVPKMTRQAEFAKYGGEIRKNYQTGGPMDRFRNWRGTLPSQTQQATGWEGWQGFPYAQPGSIPAGTRPPQISSSAAGPGPVTPESAASDIGTAPAMSSIEQGIQRNLGSPATPTPNPPTVRMAGNHSMPGAEGSAAGGNFWRGAFGEELWM